MASNELANREAIQSALRDAYLQMLRDVGLDLPFADHRPAQLPNPTASNAFDPRAAKELIRYMQNMRKYSSWQSVGTEPPANFMARLANVKTESRPYLGDQLPHAQGALDNQMIEVRGWLEQQGIKLPCELFAGLYPTGDLNARVVLVQKTGILLLMNVGLMDLIFMLLKTARALAPAKNKAPLLTEEQAVRVLADVFNAYLYGEGSLGAWALPRLPEELERPLDFVLQRAEQFVLAHEIGHVVLGHISIDGAGKQHRVGDYTPQEEYDADTFAVDLMLNAHKRDPQSKARSQHFVGAISIFFVIGEVIQILQKELKLSSSHIESHPALRDRGNRIAARLQKELGEVPNVLNSAETFAAWLYTSTLPACEWLLNVNLMMRRSKPYD
jgi:hypothetical protein